MLDAGFRADFMVEDSDCRNKSSRNFIEFAFITNVDLSKID